MPDTELDMQEWLSELLYESDEDLRVSTYEDAGLLTMNKGVVVRFAGGSEFQIQIVRSR